MGYAMQPPPPPLDVPQLKGLVAKADLVVVGEVREVKETEATDGAVKRVRIDAVLKIARVIKGKCEGADLLIEESYTAPGSTLSQCTPAAGEDRGKVIVGEWAGPAKYHGVYTKGSRIIALLAPVKGGGAYRPLGSGTYNEHLGEFLVENNAVRAVSLPFAAGLERYAHSENEFIDLVAALTEGRQ